MMIFKKAIPRRTFLRGMGASLAVPLLDGMVPAFAGPLDKTAANPAFRLQYVYVPNGIIKEKYRPAEVGVLSKLTPTLEPLAPLRDNFLVLSGLDGGPVLVGGHPRACSMWLTSAEPLKSAYTVHSGISVDQVAAKKLGKHTPLRSLEICVENAAEMVGTASGYNSAYINTISWSTPTAPVPMEDKPRGIFERLFGDGGSTDPAARRARIQEDRSILDFVTQDVARLVKGLGPSDSSKITQYLDGVRDVERRIQVAEQRNSRELPMMERPLATALAYEDHVKLMFDLQVLAYQTDMTRVITFMMAREKSEMVYTQLGVTEPHHALSHNRGDRTKIAATEQINLYHAKLFADYLEKLRSTPDGDGSLLDHVMIVYGSGLSDGDLHTQRGLTVLLVGGGAGQIKKAGRHLRYPEGTPFSNFHVATLDMVGIPTEKFGDSTGKLDLSSVV